nr:hypothetical protein KK1_020165 [Ipomoea batatas]
MSRIKKRQKGTTERKGLRRLRLPEIRPFRTGFPTGRDIVHSVIMDLVMSQQMGEVDKWQLDDMFMHTEPTLRVTRVALGEEHISPGRGATLVSQPCDGVGQAILALRLAQVLRALRHALDAPGPTDPEVLSPSRQIRQHGIAARLVVGAVRDRRPTLVRNYRLVLRPEERNIIVLHETPVQLQRAAGGIDAQHPELTHRPPHAIPAIRAAQIAAALVKAVNNVALGRARDGYLVVIEISRTGRVNERGEDRVNV